eukprot:scaffold2089_cov336-Prasinococcus_capsulatus_cf.AAC.8
MASHRLVQWITKTVGINAAEAVYSELNKRHFEDGERLNNPDMLAKVAAEVAGVNQQEATDFVIGPQGLNEIRSAQKLLSDLGIHRCARELGPANVDALRESDGGMLRASCSIPTFIMGGQMIVNGAVKSDELVRIFRRIEKSGQSFDGSVFADVLGIPEAIMEKEFLHVAQA